MSSKKTTTSQQQSTSTSSLDPAYAALVYGNAARAQGLANTPYQPYAGQRVAGFTPDQVMAQGLFGNIAGGQVGGDTLNSAVAAAKAAGGYAPALVSAPTTATFDYAPAKAAAVAPAVAGLVDRSAVRDVGADSLAGADLSAYTNPFTQSVIDTTAADLDRQRQRQQVQNAAQATKAGAWRGDALAVTNALSDETWNRNLASTLAGLRQQGFTQATQNAQQDLARRQAAEVANQAADLNVAGANAQATTAANQFNAGQAQTRSLADAAAANTALGAGAAARNAASLADSDAGLRAALANQSALETANQQRLTSAGLLGDFSDRELSQAAQRASLVGAVGDAQQQQNQAQLDWQYQNDYQAPRDYAVGMQQLLNQSLGLVPATGTTSANSSGTETVKQSPGLTGILGGLGGLFQGMSGLGFQLPA